MTRYVPTPQGDGDPGPDLINQPPHYKMGAVESIDLIESLGFGVGFCAGNAIKYLMRFQFKGSDIADAKKARWYVDRLIANLENGRG